MPTTEEKEILNTIQDNFNKLSDNLKEVVREPESKTTFQSIMPQIIPVAFSIVAALLAFVSATQKTSYQVDTLKTNIARIENTIIKEIKIDIDKLQTTLYDCRTWRSKAQNELDNIKQDIKKLESNDHYHSP